MQLFHVQVTSSSSDACTSSTTTFSRLLDAFCPATATWDVGVSLFSVASWNPRYHHHEITTQVAATSTWKASYFQHQWRPRIDMKKNILHPGSWRIFESWICTYTTCEDRMPKMMSKQKHVNKTLFNLSTQNQFSSSFCTSSGSAGIIFSSPGISSWPVTLPDATTFVTESAVVAATVGTTGSGRFTGGPGETCPTSGGFSSPAKLSQESQASLVDSVVPTLSSFKSPFSISNKACQFTKGKILGGKSPRLWNQVLASKWVSTHVSAHSSVPMLGIPKIEILVGSLPPIIMTTSEKKFIHHIFVKETSLILEIPPFSAENCWSCWIIKPTYITGAPRIYKAEVPSHFLRPARHQKTHLLRAFGKLTARLYSQCLKRSAPWRDDGWWNRAC